MFKAILSLDAYNRGYDAGIDLREVDSNGNPIPSDTNGIKIGGATVINSEGGPTVIANSFYSIAYSYDNKTIISYRGTNDPLTGIWDVIASQDIWNGPYGILLNI